MLAREGKYNDCLFHRLVPGFMVCNVAYHQTYHLSSDERYLGANG
jgi:cyclophilin family peptidyl-prolyl cis-trans isomerase